jgi:hypothetical protein
MASPVEGSAARTAGWVQYPDPAGVPRVPVVDIVCSLQFYLDEMGCVVREVADGWALLRSGPFALLLIHEPTPTDPARPPLSLDSRTAEVRPRRRSVGAAPVIPRIRLSTPDLRALRCRLGADVLRVRPGPGPGPGHNSVDEIEMYDPDQHRVVITQAGSCSPPQQMSTAEKEDPGRRPPPDNVLSRRRSPSI